MNEPISSADRNLQAWLDVAVSRLSLASKLRVTGEVMAHYDDAVAEMMAAGKPEEEAQKMAFEGLGDAEEANRRFRKIHVTDDEALWVSDFRYRPGFWRILAYSLMLALASVIRLGYETRTQSDLAVVSILIPAAALLMWILAVPWLHRRGHHRPALVLAVVLNFTVLFGVLIGPEMGSAFALLFVLILAFWMARLVPILRKVWSEPPEPC